MIPHCSTALLEANPLCITTAAMDGSVNDRATKRQRGVHNDEVSRGSNHTVSTSSSTYSGNSRHSDATAATTAKQVSFAPFTSMHGSDWTRDEVDAGWYSVSQDVLRSVVWDCIHPLLFLTHLIFFDNHRKTN
jgi:hypothetical protein